jgi:hypothetical protein
VNRPVAIVVLGMHRSGTSALTGCLDIHGVPLGAPLMPANYDNERGYFELTEVVTIHDELLGSFGASALDLTKLPAEWASQPTARRAQERLHDVLRLNFDGKPLWGVKDPRLCVLLPLWEPLFRDMNVEPRYVLMLRSPWEVAKSLEARNGLETWESLDLWVGHVAAAERESRARRRAVTTFDRFLADPGMELSYLAGFLEIAWPRALDDPVREELHAFLEPSIRHFRKVEPPEDIDRGLVNAVEELHSSLMALRDSASAGLSTRIEAASSVSARLLAARRASAARINTSEDEYDLRWLRADVPEQMAPGQRLFIEGTFVHEGARPLSKRVLSISYHWVDAADPSKIVVWDGLRTPVKRVLLPGEEYESQISVQAPSQPGRYRLLLDVVREGVAWFSSTRLPPSPAEVIVTGTSEVSPPRRS